MAPVKTQDWLIGGRGASGWRPGGMTRHAQKLCLSVQGRLLSSFALTPDLVGKGESLLGSLMAVIHSTWRLLPSTSSR